MPANETLSHRYRSCCGLLDYFGCIRGAGLCRRNNSDWIVSMKKIVFIAALMAACVATPAAAQMTIKEKQDKMCPAMAGLASSIMEGRQLGVSMVDMMNAPGSDNEQAKEISRSFVKMAYEKPRYSTEEFQKRAITDFANDISRMCYATK